ncbi:MAG: flavin reductase family protein, partial [Chloroflexi bacterium]|nr:flavin reductase family protein [Chloroflexota bacterium]
MAGSRPEDVGVLSHFWTPLVAVGCSQGDRLNAQISVSTFGASIVPDRPRLLCVLYKANLTHELIAAKGSFSVSLLADDQRDLIPKLGFVSGRNEDKMAGLEVDVTPEGNPILTGCLAWLECDVIDSFDLGDATCFLGAVTAMESLRVGEPMFWAQIRTTLPEEWLVEWDQKIAGDIERYRQMMLWLGDQRGE